MEFMSGTCQAQTIHRSTPTKPSLRPRDGIAPDAPRGWPGLAGSRCDSGAIRRPLADGALMCHQGMGSRSPNWAPTRSTRERPGSVADLLTMMFVNPRSSEGRMFTVGCATESSIGGLGRIGLELPWAWCAAAGRVLGQYDWHEQGRGIKYALDPAGPRCPTLRFGSRDSPCDRWNKGRARSTSRPPQHVIRLKNDV